MTKNKRVAVSSFRLCRGAFRQLFLRLIAFCLGDYNDTIILDSITNRITLMTLLIRIIAQKEFKYKKFEL